MWWFTKQNQSNYLLLPKKYVTSKVGQVYYYLLLPRISITNHYQHQFRWNRSNGSSWNWSSSECLNYASFLFYERDGHSWSTILSTPPAMGQIWTSIAASGRNVKQGGNYLLSLVAAGVVALNLLLCWFEKLSRGPQQKYHDRVLPTMFYVKCTQRKNPQGFQNRMLQQNGIKKTTNHNGSGTKIM